MMHANRNQPPGAGPMRVGVWSKKHGPWDSTLLLVGTECGGTPAMEGSPKDRAVQVTVSLHTERPGVFLASPAPRRAGVGHVSRAAPGAGLARRRVPTQPEPPLAGRWPLPDVPARARCPAERGCGSEPSPHHVERMSPVPGSGHSKRPARLSLHDGAVCYAVGGHWGIL